MPLFALHAIDKTHEGPAIRAANRAAHLEWGASLGAMITQGGPLLAEDGETMIGSLLIIEADSLQAVKDLSANDPYVKAGLFETVSITGLKWLLGK